MWKHSISGQQLDAIIWKTVDGLPEGNFKNRLMVKLILAVAELEKELETKGVEITA